MEVDEDFNDRFIADCARQARQDEQMRRQRENSRLPMDRVMRAEQDDQLARSQDVIRQAEAKKGSLFTTKGNYKSNDHPNLLSWADQQALREIRSADVDENYLVMGAHVDSATQSKIVNNEYVDFAKLLPKGRFSKDNDESRLELVSRGGATFFVPASNRDNVAIINFSKWEQAFRVFSNIYIRAYPSRATELIQYNHIIHMAASTYTWENVYMYDKEFRTHISHFPQRSWSVILQQAWAMYLKDRIQFRNDKNNNYGQQVQSDGSPSFRKEICQRFNKGKCTNGRSCKYYHRCDPKLGGCGKFGHGVHICRLASGKKKQNNQASTSAAPTN